MVGQPKFIWDDRWLQRAFANDMTDDEFNAQPTLGRFTRYVECMACNNPIALPEEALAEPVYAVFDETGQADIVLRTERPFAITVDCEQCQARNTINFDLVSELEHGTKRPGPRFLKPMPKPNEPFTRFEKTVSIWLAFIGYCVACIFARVMDGNRDRPTSWPSIVVGCVFFITAVFRTPGIFDRYAKPNK